MQVLLTLLMTALQLKLMVLGLPVEYQSTKDAVLPIVENAIMVAQTELAKISTVENVENTIASSTPVSIVGAKREYDVFGGGCSKIRFQLHVAYSDGSKGFSDRIIMITPDESQNAIYSATMQGDRSLVFEYVPKSISTDEVVTFTAESLTFSTTIHVGENPFLDEGRLENARKQGSNIQVVDGKCVSPIFDIR